VIARTLINISKQLIVIRDLFVMCSRNCNQSAIDCAGNRARAQQPHAEGGGATTMDPSRQSNLLSLELSQRALELIAAADGSRELHSQTQLQFRAGIFFIARAPV
jgi:hypothetical protein